MVPRLLRSREAYKHLLQATPRPKLLYPAAGVRLDQTAQPTYLRSALHQAHLRSPVLIPETIAEVGESSKKLYRRVVGFALAPSPLQSGKHVLAWPFAVSTAEHGALPPDGLYEMGRPNLRELDAASRTFRIRCIRVTSPIDLSDSKRWVVSDTHWPSDVLLSINSTQLEMRRKLHHAKDFPVNVTRYIKEGVNLLSAFIISDKLPRSYAFAVEIVGCMTLEDIVTACLSRTVPAEIE
ncbi:hypothetical protein BJ546DRAFT_1067164 [Cryomyces antarcticus]